MCLLFESIKVKDRILHNLDYHNERMNRSRFELFGRKDEIDLSEHVQIPDDLDCKIYKCRIIYDRQIQQMEFEKYKIPATDGLHMVEANINYTYKFLDRSAMDVLKKDLQSNEEILIVKDGFITDCSFANVCFWDGEKWLTPNTPLLKGTKRQKLLDAGEISEASIRPGDLAGFVKVCLINGMLELGELILYDV